MSKEVPRKARHKGKMGYNIELHKDLFIETENTMSNPSSLSPFTSNTPNYAFSMHNPDHPSFHLSDYLLLGDCSEEESTSPVVGFSSNPQLSTENLHDDSGLNADADPRSSIMNSGSEERKIMMESGIRIAFRTKSELEILDDGFKWRKYGKKTVKNSPNPRNYYRCSNALCSVKKRVERDRDDPSYVITTYEGVHNHQSPCVVYCTPNQSLSAPIPNQDSLRIPHQWNLQTASHSSW